jgi:hypothetical protein
MLHVSNLARERTNESVPFIIGVMCVIESLYYTVMLCSRYSLSNSLSLLPSLLRTLGRTKDTIVILVLSPAYLICSSSSSSSHCHIPLHPIIFRQGLFAGAVCELIGVRDVRFDSMYQLFQTFERELGSKVSHHGQPDR